MPHKDIHGLEELPPTLGPRGKNYLLLISIDDYAHCPKLHNAVKDARDLVQVLKTRFQFEEENIQELYDQEATKRNIYHAFRRVASQVTPEDSIIIYFSGHGEYDKTFNLGYWIPVEAHKDAVDEYVPNSEIRNILSAIKSHHTFLMVDSCFSGSLFAKSGSRNVSLRKERDPSRWGLTAGRNEIVTDGERGTNSPFAKSILYQLKNTDKPIGVAELCDKVLEVVSANANQTPRGEPLKVEGHQGGQFVFHLKKDEVADWKATQEAGTIAAFQSFLIKYPEGKNTPTAKSKLSALKAEKEWEEIKVLPDDNPMQVRTKVRSIHKFLKTYPQSPLIQEAEDLGERLDYKDDFLKIQNNLFALKKFSRQDTPFKEEALKRIKILEEDLYQEEQAAADEKARKEAVERKAVEKSIEEEKRKQHESRKQASTPHKSEPKTVSSTPSKSSPPRSTKTGPNFFQKNYKYIFGAAALVLVIWIVIKMIPDSSSTTKMLTQLVKYQDETTQLWGYKYKDIIAIPAKYDMVSDFDKEGTAKVSQFGLSFFIDHKGNCVRLCPTEKELEVARAKHQGVSDTKVDQTGKAEYDVLLNSFGASKLQVIKELRNNISGLGLKEAKDLVDNAPCLIKEGVSKKEAERIETALEAKGAKVELVTPKIITNTSGLKYKDIKVGTGRQLRKGQKITVHYTGTLENGKKFDSSFDRGEPFSFTLGEGKVIPAWEEGLATMRLEGKRRLIVPPELGYGARGMPGKIPGNAVTIYEVEVLKIE